MLYSSVIVLLVMTMVPVTQGQGAGRRGGQVSRREELLRGAQSEHAAESVLQAAERDVHAEEVLLDQQTRQQARLDRKAARREKKQARQARKEASRLQAAKSLDYETYMNNAEFHNLDAAADIDKANKLGLSIVSETFHKESAAMSKSGGSRGSSGTRLTADEFVEGESILESEDAVYDAFDEEDYISAADAGEDTLNAQQRLNKEQAAKIDAYDSIQQRGFLQNLGSAGEQAGFDAGFEDFLGGGGGFGLNNRGFGGKK